MDAAERPTARRALCLAPEPADSRAPALPCGLVYVSDTLLPGISREAGAGGFTYRWPDGRSVDDEGQLERIRRLAIPPAYAQVWICPLPSGHLQATGRDARGRKQYRYHAEWNAQRNADKFARLEAFGRALPAIRRRVARDLARDDAASVAHRVVLATLVRLLDTIFVRVGNEVYVRQNGSYGLTTLRNRHAEVSRKGRLRVSFRGKSGVRQNFSLDDPRIARVIRRCKQLPGQDLFQYEDQGVVRGIGSGDVNDYLSDAAGERFTAKDFRTWHGTVQALELTRLAALAKNGAEGCGAQQILIAVAHRLGNTVAVCRKSYVHPRVLALAQTLGGGSGAIASACENLHGAGRSRGLHAAERRLLNFLAQQHGGRRTSATQKSGKAAA